MYKDGFIFSRLFSLGSAARFARLLFGLLGCNLGSEFPALFKSVDVSAGIEQFLLTSIKWVTVAANFGINLGDSRPGGKFVAASATHNHVGVVFRMNSLFHIMDPFRALLCI